MSGRWGLGDPWQSVRLPQAAALHGILLPAGVVKWDPVAGKADRVALLSCPGGLQVDAQGSQAPTPAASRLFVDIEEGAKVGVAFSRAVLRHACFLAGPRPRTSSWEGWLLGLIECSRSLLFWAEAMCHEFELLEEALGYEIQGESQSVSRAELRSRFGRYVPIGGAGLSNWDDVTRWLVDARPRRKVGDQWEVDLDADPAPSPDGMRSSYAIWPED
jgi:hypothetical protein